MTEFNEEQLAAIETPARHVLVLAGAGTGKTTTIVGRCNHLIESGVPEKDILLITFTRRAANELRGRIHGVSRKRTQVTASTFHSWAMRLIRLNPRVFRLESPTLIDRDDIISIFRRYRKQHSSDSLPKAAVFADFHSLLINTLLSPEDAAKVAQIDEHDIPALMEGSEHFIQYKRDRNYIDYDDILHRVAESLAIKGVAKAIGQRFQHVMIDEMQDTNPLQYLIVDALAPHTHLFCVGDDAQSIYGFRGADFESIHGFKERYPDATILKLQENYRSTQEILDISNWLLDCSPLGYEKKLRAARGSGNLPVLRDFEDQWQQADYVSDTILDAFETEECWANNMVLARTGYSARPIESRFIEKQIPYILIGGQSLFGARHVKDVMSLLKIYANRADELAWMRYLQLWHGLGEVTAERIFRDVALGEQPPLSGEGRGESLATLVSEHTAEDQFGWTVPISRCLAASSKPLELFDAAVSSLNERLSTIFKNDNWDARQRDFVYVRELAKRHRTVQGFIDQYLINPVYEKELRDADKNQDVVRIITIHSAKGLEASRCFAIDVARGMYPKPGSTDKEIEEERRVLYVAMTRAANELHITRAERGWAVAAAPNRDQAYFLEDLPLELVDYDVVLEDPDEDDELAIRF